MHLERGAFFFPKLQQDMESRSKTRYVILFVRKERSREDDIWATVLKMRVSREYFDRCVYMIRRIGIVDVLKNLNEFNIGFSRFLPGDL